MAHGRPTGRVVVLAMGALLLLTGCLKTDADYLSSDALGGRDNGSAGSLLAQDYLIGGLQRWAVGPVTGTTDPAGYKQAFAGGTNIIGVIPGTDLADQYVMVGAHYDGHGSDASCAGKTPADSICNGATDNAAGVSIVLNLAQQLAEAPTRPRRSVIVAFWDREEDGLLGSNAYVTSPLVPLAKTVAYVNLDIQGANLRPAVRSFTFAVGAETGGPVLTGAVAAAMAPTALQTRRLSLVFGQGRSDHTNLLGAHVPSVFFSDSTGPCYHTVGDDADVLDASKLQKEFGTTSRLVTDLANRDDTPTYTASSPLATFADAQVVSELLHADAPDLPTFSPADQAALTTDAANVDAVLAAGPGAFDNNAILAVLTAAQSAVTILTHGPCDGFLAP